MTLLERIEYDTETIVNVELVFDYKKTKHVTLKKNNLYTVVYNKKGKLVTKTGNLDHIIVCDQIRYEPTDRSPMDISIVLDASEDLDSDLDKINLYDIRDIFEGETSDQNGITLKLDEYVLLNDLISTTMIPSKVDCKRDAIFCITLMNKSKYIHGSTLYEVLMNSYSKGYLEFNMILDSNQNTLYDAANSIKISLHDGKEYIYENLEITGFDNIYIIPIPGFYIEVRENNDWYKMREVLDDQTIYYYGLGYKDIQDAILDYTKTYRFEKFSYDKLKLHVEFLYIDEKDPSKNKSYGEEVFTIDYHSDRDIPEEDIVIGIDEIYSLDLPYDDIIYESSDEGIATVDEYGFVYAIKPGVVKIMYYSESNESIADIVTVTVE